MTTSLLTVGAHVATAANDEHPKIDYTVDRFADIEILRYEVPGFEELSLQQKQLLYHLSEAALMGRDIIFDQNCRYNLAIRRALEAIYREYRGDRGDAQFKALETYLKRVWLANGIHHHYGEDKFEPAGFTADYFAKCIRSLDPKYVPVRKGQTVDAWLKEITPVIFDPKVMPKRTVQSGEGDILLASANNYYEGGITQKEAEDFYARMRLPNDTMAVSYGLNSRLAKVNGELVEKVWKVGGLYTQAIERIVDELQKAVAFAENDAQRAVIEKLIVTNEVEVWAKDLGDAETILENAAEELSDYAFEDWESLEVQWVDESICEPRRIAAAQSTVTDFNEDFYNSEEQ